MDLDINLKKIERKAMTSVYEDGLWDLFFGFLFFGGVIQPFFSWLPVIYSLLPQLISGCIGVMILVIGKRYVTTPRLGIFKYGPKQKTRRKRITLILTVFAIINVLFLVIGLIFSMGFPIFAPQLPKLPVQFKSFQGYLTALGIGLLAFSLPLGVVSYILDFDRGIIIAIMGGMGFFLSEIFGNFVITPFDSALAFGIIASVTLTMGVIYFVRFLQKYPLPKEETVNGYE